MDIMILSKYIFLGTRRCVVGLLRGTVTPIQKAKAFSSERSCGRQLSLLEKLVGR